MTAAKVFLLGASMLYEYEQFICQADGSMLNAGQARAAMVAGPTGDVPWDWVKRPNSNR